MASGINNADDKLNIQQLQVAAQLGIKRYRMGYHKYDLEARSQPGERTAAGAQEPRGTQQRTRSASDLPEPFRQQLRGRPLWDLHELFKAHDPAHLAVGFDMSHATAEGTRAWPLHANLLRPRIGALYVKDFRWTENKRDNCPLAEVLWTENIPRN